MCDFAHVLDIIKHYIFILYNYMCITKSYIQLLFVKELKILKASLMMGGSYQPHDGNA